MTSRNRTPAHGRARRRARAADRLTAALLDKRHEWKSASGPENAQACLAKLTDIGASASTIVDAPEM